MNHFMPPREHDLYFRKTVTRWDEAIPLGSGLTGCLLWGDGAPLRLSLDRGDLWDNRPAPETLAHDYTYEELIKLVKMGNQEEILRRFDTFYGKPTPTKIPAGRLELVFDNAADNVESRLSLERAEAELTLHYGADAATVQSFLHARDKYGFLRISGAKPSLHILSHDFTADPEHATSNNHSTDISIRMLGYPPVELFTIGRVNVALQHTAEELTFALMTASAERAGCLEAVYFVASSLDGPQWLENAVDKLENALNMGYEAAILAHLEWWRGFWGKCRIRLQDKVIEKNWYLTNYLLGSCSRKGCPPMPLQGVWTADEGLLPPWKGDYHGDLNTQFSYYNFLKSDHLEEGESFIDFMWSLNDKARAFAKSFFDADGLCLPSVFGFDGTSLGGWVMYATNITNQIWQDHIFYLYYQYTGDTDFLRERLYPYLKGTEAVVRRFLIEDENGKLVLPLSSSPELHNNKLAAWLPSISNYDLALLRFLYEALIELAPAVSPDDVGEWRRIYSRLPELATDEALGFKVTADENLLESHRHLSHMMAVFPLDLCRFTRSAEEARLITASIDHLEWLGRGMWVGFAFSWMAEIYARAFNGEGAAYQLRSFFDHICSQNGFNLNGDFRNTGITSIHYRPFTLEANMCAADAVQEMLMQCYDGVIRVFPAIPDEWRELGCEFEGLLSYGGVKVSSSIEMGEVRCVKLAPKRDAMVKIYNPFASERVAVSSTEGELALEAASGAVLELNVKAGIEYMLSAV